MLPGIGVFGTAAEVRVLVPILRDKGFKIEAIWGRTICEAEEAAKELNIIFYTNKIDDVLLKKDVDLVFIFCPPHLHSQISVKALGIGKHVVCERMGLGQVDALKMVRGSQYYPSLISLVNYSLRFLPAFVDMKRRLHEEYLGPIKYVSLIDVRVQIRSLLSDKYDWLCDATMGGGVLNLIGSHIIDLVSFLIGRRATKVHGVVKTYNKMTKNVCGIRQVTAPDFCNFQMELDGGEVIVTVSILTNISSTTFLQEVLVCGRDGHLIVRNTDLFGQRNSTGKEETLFVDKDNVQTATSVNNVMPYPYINGMCKMIGALRESFIQEQSSWVKEPVQSAATFEHGLYVQAVLDAIRQSSENKTWLKVNVMSESPTNHAKIMTAARMSAVVMH
ncbi:glucose-fructose oxidoreductase domain-containing protein 2 [Sitodiplosis mosellana]|uniref:glucose-fructose oxidoreductase domain-containing protein 2 n=1 Tax=Sitodiplosis mosellana TaxID=263140 RepID=UPI002443C6C5|nr:glucose-fructose oxidoreductase domain-containing protein 2 [Sitodiplosis mosellana]